MTDKKNLEKIPVLLIYKQAGKIHWEQPDEKISQWELLGFLHVYTKELEDKLLESFEGY